MSSSLQGEPNPTHINNPPNHHHKRGRERARAKATKTPKARAKTDPTPELLRKGKERATRTTQFEA